jgi:hypothetical protein
MGPTEANAHVLVWSLATMCAALLSAVSRAYRRLVHQERAAAMARPLRNAVVAAAVSGVSSGAGVAACLLTRLACGKAVRGGRCWRIPRAPERLVSPVVGAFHLRPIVIIEASTPSVYAIGASHGGVVVVVRRPSGARAGGPTLRPGGGESRGREQRAGRRGCSGSRAGSGVGRPRTSLGMALRPRPGGGGCRH